MKILGHTKLRPRTTQVSVGHTEQGERVVLELRAPRLNAMDRIQREIQDPKPPVGRGVVRNERGEPVLDPEGRPIPQRNHDDPGYQAQKSKVDRARTVAMLLECLGDQLVPEAQREAFPDLVSFYDQVWNEMEEVGLDLVAIGRLSQAAARLSGLSDDEVGDAKAELGVGKK